MTGFRSFAVCALAVLTAASLASAQQAQRITPNFKDADITQIAEAVSAASAHTANEREPVTGSTPETAPAGYWLLLSPPGTSAGGGGTGG